MNMLLSISTAALLLLGVVHSGPTAPTNKYKICVAEVNLPACQELAKQHGVRLTCIAARDRVDCIDKVQQHQADFVPADPEDMYIAAHIPQQHFTVFKEIRTKEEPTEEFRYEAVAVIHKDLDISSVQGLRGLKSCHTGVGRNVGYKIPITKLTKMGVLSLTSDPTLSARENELKALSQLFSKACLVGTWSEDPAINQRLKHDYSNLCQLCEDPAKCDYPDKYSGYDGALRCLSDNGGQIAWTKTYFVKKHFGIPIGSEPPYTVTNNTGYNLFDYAYLCPDGSKKPITERPCRWAARPWQGFLANADLSSDINELNDLRSQITEVSKQGEDKWLEDVLMQLKQKETLVDYPNPPLAPLDYLNKANYTDVIERGSGPGYKKVRICTTSKEEMDKCRNLHRAAFSRDIRPEFDCVQQSDLHACLRAIKEDGADIISLDAGELHIAQTEYNLKPIVTEVYGDHDALYYSVAVVKKSSSYKSLADLRGAKSCHTGYGRTAGWNIPLYTLLTQKLVPDTTCPHAKAMSEFFSGGSCVPGILQTENNPKGENPSKLCDLCVGDVDSGSSDAQKTKCEAGAKEAYFGYTGAFRCLASGSGDVAFVQHTTVLENTDGKNPASWAANLKSSDYELLCLDGTRKPVDQYVSCHWAQVPAHKIVTSKTKSSNEIDAIRHALLAAGNMYSRRPELFHLFGSYEGKQDLLFKNSATGFQSVNGTTPVEEHYIEILDRIKKCGGQ
ncbi:transferrin [Anabrus simplex]|uniref:transferrin n=1 Tax=Anabrus simplex TaxID=316456 RepID=UPI0035A37BA6